MYMFVLNYTKLKAHLRLAIFKLKLLQRKHSEYVQKTRKEIADLISTGKFQKARFKVEHIIAEDLYVDALEYVEMYCDLLLSQFSVIVNNKQLEECIAEAVSSIIWVAPRLTHDVYEFKIISNILRCKYGSEYAEACAEGNVATISESLRNKLSAPAPSKLRVEEYMVQIAKNYNVNYEPLDNTADLKFSNTQTLTHTPLVHFSTIFPFETSSSTHIQTSDLTDDDDEVTLDIPEEFEKKLLALNNNRMRAVQSYEMPEYPFEFNDIIYDVSDLKPASDKSEELRLAKLKRYDLPFSPLQLKPFDSSNDLPNNSSPNANYDVENKTNSLHTPSGSKDKTKSTSEDKTSSKEKKNLIMLLFSTERDNLDSAINEYKDFLTLPSVVKDEISDNIEEDNFLQLPVVPDEDIDVLPEFPSIPNLESLKKNRTEVDFDELCDRFNKLRKK